MLNCMHEWQFINLFWASNMHSQVTKSENNFHKVNSSCMVIRICHAWRATTPSIMASTAHSAMATYLAQVFFSPCMLGLTSVFYACSQHCSNMLTESSKAHVLSIHSFSMRDKTLQLSWRLERPRKIGMCMYDCCNLTASAKYVLHAWQNIRLQGYHIEIPQQRPSMNCSHGKTHCIHFNRTATAKYTHLANMDHMKSWKVWTLFSILDMHVIVLNMHVIPKSLKFSYYWPSKYISILMASWSFYNPTASTESIQHGASWPVVTKALEDLTVAVEGYHPAIHHRSIRKAFH